MDDVLKKPLPAQPRLIFMGTPDFALSTLDRLIQSGHRVEAVVTQPDRPKGRGKKITSPPVKQLAGEHGIDVLQPEKISDPQFFDRIRQYTPDLMIVVAFGQILKKNLLDTPGWGVINIHGSLLPKYRGAAPIQQAILHNESETGLTVMRMNEGLDTGPILLQEKVSILRDETAGQLHDRLAQLAGDLMITCLDMMTKNPIEEIPQDDCQATYAPKIEKHMTRIDWTLPAPAVSALIRALDPAPGAFTTWNGKNIKLFTASVVDESGPGTVPGRVRGLRENALHVEAGQGVLSLKEIHYPGKKKLAVSDFLRGLPIPEGTIFGRE
ncbi:MAG: methionyl-tRNA formyltransferase [Deltaproteobacteria bacterium]|nr:methionyl-tRNA formyltransferase [Deltaproteobacteria bacterium]